MGEKQKRVAPPQLNRIPAEALKRMKQDGLAGLCELDAAQTARIQTLICRIWETFYELIEKNGKPTIQGFFIFDADKSSGDFSQIGAVCSTWKGHSCIGLDYTVKNIDDDTAALLLLHELTHAVMLQGAHDGDFSNYLNYLLMIYNQKYNTIITNDYNSVTGKVE